VLLLIKMVRGLVLNFVFLSFVCFFFKNVVMLMLSVLLVYSSVILKSVFYVIINKYRLKFEVFIYKFFL